MDVKKFRPNIVSVKDTFINGLKNWQPPINTDCAANNPGAEYMCLFRCDLDVISQPPDWSTLFSRLPAFNIQPRCCQVHENTDSCAGDAIRHISTSIPMLRASVQPNRRGSVERYA